VVEEVVAKLSLWGKMVVAIELRLAGCRRERKGRCSHAAMAGPDNMTIIWFAKQNLGRMLLRSKCYGRSCEINLMPMMEFSEELMVELITIHFGMFRARVTETSRAAPIGAESRA